MKREVKPELLDELPAHDPRATRSRRDLRRLNALMGHPRIMAGALSTAFTGQHAQHIVELGAGDGQFLLSVARRLRSSRKKVEATLVDRLNGHEVDLRRRFEKIGWRVNNATHDVEDWFRKSRQHEGRILLNNLFLHQFDQQRLARILELASHSARVLIALEPRRAAGPLLFSRLLWFVGCGAVTRHDAPVSVRAGFRGREISELWPQNGNWKLIERPAGLFSHLFIARRKD